MTFKELSIFPDLSKTIEQALRLKLPNERQNVLQLLIGYIQNCLESNQKIHLNFICTHNSRRSQFSQLWAQIAADYYGIPASCYSGGVEVTAFNERAVASIQRSGFRIASDGVDNPIYAVFYAENRAPIHMFSKRFDDAANPSSQFAAIMTCSHADENCPFIPGAELRIPVRYDDPKAFDDTPEESQMYDERSMQIASEMLYVFSKIKY